MYQTITITYPKTGKVVRESFDSAYDLAKRVNNPTLALVGIESDGTLCYEFTW